MKTIAICLFFGASLAVSNHSFAQLRLGAVSSTRLNAATSVNTAGVNSALRATSSAERTSTAKVKTTGATVKSTSQSTVSNSNNVIAKTSGDVSTSADVQNGVDVQAGTGVNAGMQSHAGTNASANVNTTTVSPISNQAKAQAIKTSDKAVGTAQSAVKLASDTKGQTDAGVKAKTDASVKAQKQ